MSKQLCLLYFFKKCINALKMKDKVTPGQCSTIVVKTGEHCPNPARYIGKRDAYLCDSCNKKIREKEIRLVKNVLPYLKIRIT